VEGFDGLEARKAVAVEEMGTRARYDRAVEGSADGVGEPFRTGSGALRRALADTLLGDVTHA
jgi:hypothetical protein